MDKNVKDNEVYDGVANVVVFFLKPAIFLWMMPTIAGLVPALAPLCMLGYWQWVGLTLIIGWLCRWAGCIIHK